MDKKQKKKNLMVTEGQNKMIGEG
ncbi:hypothetical protein EMIT079MI2_170036 [Bacillus sp. IT-79MI2]